MDAIWEGRRVLICVGTGGVGKTTTAAAIAVAAAASGKRTLVMTIDPARRLANAMGLANVGNVERELAPELLAAHGITLGAELYVMMPNIKRIFDELVDRIAPNAERREKIIRNRFYQHSSTVLAGSLDFAAVEKLYDVYNNDRYDLIVLDTAPSQNAVSFLEAPGRILDFLEDDTIQWLVKPYALAGDFTLKLFDLGSSFILRTLSKMAGGDTIRELAEFILAFQGMYDGFRDRSRRVHSLLTSDELAFVVVTSPQTHQLETTVRLQDQLNKEAMRVGAVVVNRVRTIPVPEASRERLALRVDELLPERERETVHRALTEEAQLAAQSQRQVAALKERLSSVPLIELPELPLDVHDLDSLAELCKAFLPT